MNALLLALIAACPPDVDPRACAEVESCVARVYRARPAAEGVTEVQAALVARAEAEHACALSAWSRALGRADALHVVTSTRPVCPPAPACAPAAEVACDCGVTLVEGLAMAGACALCGGTAIAVGRAACGGGP